jgi:hypothetical protein
LQDREKAFVGFVKLGQDLLPLSCIWKRFAHDIRNFTSGEKFFRRA